MERSVETAPALLLVRFEQERYIAYRNCVKRGGRVIRAFQGQDLFMSDEARVFEGVSSRQRGAGVLYFNKMAGAESWYLSETEVRQQDWLGGMVDLVSVPLIEVPTAEHFAFAVFDLQIRDQDKFFDQYLPTLSNAISETPGRILAATLKKKALKGAWQPQFVVIQQWPSLAAFDAWYSSEAARSVQQLRRESADAYAFKFEHVF